MPRNLIKLFAVITLMAGGSSVGSMIGRNIPVEKSKSLQRKLWEDQYKLQEYTKSIKSIPSPIVVFDGSGKFKEWTSHKHVQPLKRSSETLLDSASNPLFQNKLEQLNLTNSPNAYHNPINLMYANNLTVKNYFLMMPPCNNVSSGGEQIERMQRLDEGLESKEMAELSQRPLHESASGLNASLSYTKENQFQTHEVVKETVSSTETVSSSHVTNNTMESKGILDIYGSTDHTTKFSQSNMSRSTDTTMTSTSHMRPEPQKSLNEGNSRTTLNTLGLLTTLTNGTNLATTTARMETTNSKSVLVNTSSVTGSHSTFIQQESFISSTPELSTPSIHKSAMSQRQTTPSNPIETQTTLDEKASKFLQTIEKYCETFFFEGKEETYTIHPVTFSSNELLVDFISRKPTSKDKLTNLKDKRFLVKNNPRKNVKQILSEPLHYPL